MSTTATIKVINDDGFCRRILIHADGYPEGVRPILDEVLADAADANLTPYEFVEELLDLLHKPVILHTEKESREFCPNWRYRVDLSTGVVTGTDDLT